MKTILSILMLVSVISDKANAQKASDAEFYGIVKEVSNCLQDQKDALNYNITQLREGIDDSIDHIKTIQTRIETRSSLRAYFTEMITDVREMSSTASTP